MARQAIAALQSDKSQLENVCSAWVSMEKEFGSLEDLYRAKSRVSRALRELRRRSSAREYSSKRSEINDKPRAPKEQGNLKKRNREPKGEHQMKRRKVSKSSSSKEVPKQLEKKGKNPAVFVINLKYGLTDEKLAEFFSVCGEVSTATVLKGRNKGRGKVEFVDSGSIEKALAMSGKPLEGLPVRVLPFKGDREARHKLSQERKKMHIAEKVVAPEERRSTVLISCLEMDACHSLHEALTAKRSVEGFPFGRKLQELGPVKAAFVAQNLTSLVVTFENPETARDALELSKDDTLCKGEGAMKPRRIKVTQYSEEPSHTPTVEKPYKKSKSGKGKLPVARKKNPQSSGQVIDSPAKSNEDFRKLLLRK